MSVSGESRSIQGPKILVVGVNWLGDVLFLTPAIRAIKKHFPEHHLTCAVPARCVPLLKNNPYVNEVLVWEDKLFFWAPFQIFKVWARLKKSRFNSVIFFHRSKTKAFIAWLAGIRQRIGYEAPFRGKWLTHAVPIPKERLHRVDIYLRLIQALGIPLDGRESDLFTGNEAPGELEILLKKKNINPEDPYVVVHAGGNWELKRWPAEYFAEWIRLFLEKYPPRVILCGTASERPLCEKIISLVGSDRVVSLCGETSLETLAILLKRAKLLLSNDSGPIHLAASQGTKIVGLFGPTSIEETGPISKAPMRLLRKDPGCEIPCYFHSCRDRVCMEWLKAPEVFASAIEIF